MTGGERVRWLVGRVVDAHAETPAARTLLLEVPGWPGHLAGQHVDLRLTAEDGYQAQRSYSIAAPADGSKVELTVQQVPGGEVSPYLVSDVSVGERIELRGPVGGWFTWRPEQTTPVLLVGGGSGIVPLIAMIRARAHARSRAPFRLVYSARTPQDVYYSDELRRRAGTDPGLQVTLLYTREASAGTSRPPGRIGRADLAGPPTPAPGVRSYVCGPTGFVEVVARILVESGHEAATVRTERFGPTGG